MPGWGSAWCQVAAVLFLAGCAGGATETGGDAGSSIADAVVIRAGSESAGIGEEYAWIAAHRPGARVVGQALVIDDRKSYDILTIVKAGKTEDVYFDISGFLGRL
jgi:hypothetical protein